MKKKLIVAAVIGCMLTAGAVTGCGSKTADAQATVAAESVETAAESETTESETTESEAAEGETTTAAETTSDNEEGAYLSWSAKEWSTADDGLKATVAKQYLIETTKLAAKAAGQDFTSEMEEAITDEQVAEVLGSLETAFAADDSITIQDMLDTASAALDAVMASVEETTEESKAE